MFHFNTALLNKLGDVENTDAELRTGRNGFENLCCCGVRAIRVCFTLGLTASLCWARDTAGDDQQAQQTESRWKLSTGGA